MPNHADVSTSPKCNGNKVTVSTFILTISALLIQDLDETK